MKNINDPLVANLLVPDNLKEEVWRLRKENETLLQEVQVRQKCCVFHLNKKKSAKACIIKGSLKLACYLTSLCPETYFDY